MRDSTRAAVAACLALAAAAAALSLAVADDVPDPMVTRWGAGGQADDTLPRSVALVGGPALALAAAVLVLGMARVDPLRGNIASFRGWYDGFAVLMTAFLTYAHAVTVAWNLGWALDVRRALAPALAALLIFAGLAARQAERNWVVGFRTPWTLSDDRVWRAVHDRAGLLLALVGVLALAGLVWPGLLGWPLGAAAAGVAAYAFVDSYLRYRRLERDDDVEPDDLGP